MAGVARAVTVRLGLPTSTGVAVRAGFAACARVADRVDDFVLDLCKSISDVQEIRNKVAHHYLTYSLEGKAGYRVRKKDAEFLHDKGAGKKG